MSNPSRRHPAIEEYLRELEIAAKQGIGVYPNQILRDAEEHLVRDCEALLQVEPGLTNAALLEHFRKSYGEPTDVAGSYEQFSETKPSIIPALAPDWRIHCSHCGRIAPAQKVGITRIGARSIGKMVLGWCRGCKRLRWLHLTQDLNIAGTVEPNEGLETSPLGRSVQASRVPGRALTTFFVLFLIASVILAQAELTSVIVASQKGRVSSQAPGLQSFPAGWELVREGEVTGTQLAQISQKINAPITKLFNTIVRFDNKELQINTLVAKTLDEAAQLKTTLQKGKSNPRWIVQNRTNVYEFVVRTAEDGRLASVARYAFSIQPKQQTYQVAFEAIPVASESKGLAPDARNRLFNLMLQAPKNATLGAEIESLSKSFQFAKGFNLVANLQGQTIAKWQATGAEVASSSDPELTAFTVTKPQRKFGMPSVALVGTIAMDATPQRAVDAKLDRAKFLVSNSRFPADAPEIHDLVKQLVGAEKSDSVKLRKLLDWFGNPQNIHYDGLTGSRYGAQAVLKQHFGRCWDYSDLFITMARCAGLPARQVYGWLSDSEGHVWCDILINGQWQMVDPTTGTACGTDYIPFCVSTDGELPWIYAGNVTISVAFPSKKGT